MTAILFIAQRASAAVLAFAVTVHLATILYAVRGGLTAGEVLARTRDNHWFFAFYVLFVIAVAVHAPIGLRNVLREWTPAFGYKQYGVPYHPGALKFFKERNLTAQPLG